MKITSMQIKKLACGLLLASSLAPLSAETVTPDADEQWKIKCECLVKFDHCQKQFIATATGKPLQSWFQDVFVKKGSAIDLNAACHRKRDTNPGGEELCCSIPGDDATTIKNLFRGTKY